MRRLICAFVVRIWHDTFSNGPAHFYRESLILFAKVLHDWPLSDSIPRQNIKTAAHSYTFCFLWCLHAYNYGYENEYKRKNRFERNLRWIKINMNYFCCRLIFPRLEYLEATSIRLTENAYWIIIILSTCIFYFKRDTRYFWTKSIYKLPCAQIKQETLDDFNGE